MSFSVGCMASVVPVCKIGRHNCLWCHITSANLKVPLEKRGCCPPRTLETLQSDYEHFMTAGGGNIKVAKAYNNVIEPYFFDIPLENVREIIDNLDL